MLWPGTFALAMILGWFSLIYMPANTQGWLIRERLV